MIRNKLLSVISNLEKFRQWRERDYGLFHITEESATNVLESYKKTILGVKERYTIEPVSALWIQTGKSKVHLEWQSYSEKIGKKVKTLVSGQVRPTFRPLVSKWENAGYPYPSTGSVFCSIPNKSFERIETLAKYPDFLMPILNYKMEELWIDFWTDAIQIRFDATTQMLEMKKTDPEIFSKANKAAGTGTILRGIRTNREMLDRLDPKELEFLKFHQAGSAIMFAATQIVRPAPGKVWVINYLDPRIVGAVAARSDADPDEIRFDGETLTMTILAKTRQVGTDASGVLANAISEKKVFGRSVSEEIWRRAIEKYGASEQKPPFFGLNNLFRLWSTPTTGNEMVIIGEDFGLDEPIKAGADNLFSSTFIRMGNKVLPHLLSGTWYTTLTYVPIQINRGRKIRELGGEMFSLGDDMTTVVEAKAKSAAEAVFYPYLKVKSTKGNNSKILGFWTYRLGNRYLIAQVPRVLKTMSSASQFATEWTNALPKDVGSNGNLEIEIPPSIELAVKTSLPAVRHLVYFEGTREQLPQKMSQAWRGTVNEEFLPEWVKFFKPDEPEIGDTE